MKTVSESIKFPCQDSFMMSGYLSRPEQEGTFPAIVFMFEAFGLNKEMKRLADEIAAAGYVVIIPNLFDRGNAILCVYKLFKDLKAEKGRGVDDLLSARKWLREQDFVNPERLAVLGLCLGGGFALILAKTGLFKAAADFYGEPPATLDGACPIMASYGGLDKSLMPKVPALEQELERLKIPNDFKVYPDAGHSFMNRQPNKLVDALVGIFPPHIGYVESAAKDAMNRLLGFLSQHV